LQLGAGFRVRGLPPSYVDFESYWQQTWLPEMQDQTQAARFIVQLVQSPPKPKSASWLPQPAWHAMTWPLRNLLWTGMLLVTPPEMARMLEIEPSRSDRASLAVHRALWRRLPRATAGRLTERMFQLRFRHGSPPWRRHYSPEALAARRIANKEEISSRVVCPNGLSVGKATPVVHAAG